MPYDQDGWIDITHIGSVYETQWNAVTNAHRHRPLSLGVDGLPDRRWVDRAWTPGPPPGDIEPVNDNVDERLETAMAHLERTIEEVSGTVSEFRRSMAKLARATRFLFWSFIVLGLCLMALGWMSLP